MKVISGYFRLNSILIDATIRLTLLGNVPLFRGFFLAPVYVLGGSVRRYPRRSACFDGFFKQKFEALILKLLGYKLYELHNFLQMLP